MMGSQPAASSTRMASGTATANPPAWPRVAIDRMKASWPTWLSMRIRSPRMAPPVSGELGSMARMAGRLAPEAAASRPAMVDLPAPGAPVTPTTRALPALR